MGTVYNLPVVGTGVTITPYALKYYSELTSDELSDYNYIRSNGLYVVNGTPFTPPGNSATITSYLIGTVPSKICFYKAYNSTYSDYCAVMIGYYSASNTTYSSVLRQHPTTPDRVQISSANETAGYFESSYMERPYTACVNAGIDVFTSYQDAKDALMPEITFPITYRLTNCTAPTAPTEAVGGSVVTVPLTFSDGYGIVNPSSDIYVTNNGVVVPSTYSNGVLTFTMPDPT